MEQLDSITRASSARIHHFTMDDASLTAMIRIFSSFNFQKQLEILMNGVQYKKKFENWLKNEEV